MESYRNKTCQNYQFAEPFRAENYHGTNTGSLVICRRNPPFVITDTSGKLATKWPIVPSSSWCGEWNAE